MLSSPLSLPFPQPSPCPQTAQQLLSDRPLGSTPFVYPTSGGPFGRQTAIWQHSAAANSARLPRRILNSGAAFRRSGAPPPPPAFQRARYEVQIERNIRMHIFLITVPRHPKRLRQPRQNYALFKERQSGNGANGVLVRPAAAAPNCIHGARPGTFPIHSRRPFSRGCGQEQMIHL